MRRELKRKKKESQDKWLTTSATLSTPQSSSSGDSFSCSSPCYFSHFSCVSFFFRFNSRLIKFIRIYRLPTLKLLLCSLGHHCFYLLLVQRTHYQCLIFGTLASKIL